MLHRILLLVVLGALCAAGNAHAAGWAPSGPLSDASGQAASAHVLITPDGGRVALWIRSTTSPGAPQSVDVRSAPAGGGFGPVQTFASPAQDLTVGQAADGTIVAAWSDLASGAVHAIRRAPGEAAFTELTPLALPPGQYATEIGIAFSGDDAYLTYVLGSSPATSVWAAEAAAADTALRTVPGAAAGGAIDQGSAGPGQPAIGADQPTIVSDGSHVTIAWATSREEADRQHGSTQVRSSVLAAGGASFTPYQAVDALSNSGTSTPPAVDLTGASGAGHAFIVWKRNADAEVRYVAAPGGGASSAIPTGRTPLAVQAATDAAGTLTVAWEAAGATGNSVVSNATVPLGGTATAPVALTSDGVDRHLAALTVAADGTAVALLHRYNINGTRVRQTLVAVRPAGAAFGPVEDASGLVDDPYGSGGSYGVDAVAAAPGGRAIAAWVAADGAAPNSSRLFVAERDTTPPTITALTVPTSTVAGQRVALSVDASDTLSGVTASWDFGDGSQADGTAVTHVFGSAGAVTVTATVRDSVGNTTQRTAVVAVAPAPAAAGAAGDSSTSPPPADRIAPALGGLTLTHSRFRVGTAGTTAVAAAKAKKGKRAPVGTTIKLAKLSERATVVVNVTHVVKRRSVLVGTLVRASVAPGAVSIPFTGRIDGRALAAGRYTLTVSAIDGAGNRSRPATAKITVVKRP